MQIRPILGYFWAIFGLYQPPAPPPLDIGLPFSHILDPPLNTSYILEGEVGEQSFKFPKFNFNSLCAVPLNR